jgi:hypothetical protein
LNKGRLFSLAVVILLIGLHEFSSYLCPRFICSVFCSNKWVGAAKPPLLIIYEIRVRLTAKQHSSVTIYPSRALIPFSHSLERSAVVLQKSISSFLQNKMVILTDEQIAAAEKGLWRQDMEKDACGVGFVTSIKGIPSHKILQDANVMLDRMAHRGACACDNDTGDGAGVLSAIPDAVYREELKR